MTTTTTATDIARAGKTERSIVSSLASSVIAPTRSRSPRARARTSASSDRVASTLTEARPRRHRSRFTVVFDLRWRTGANMSRPNSPPLTALSSPARTGANLDRDAALHRSRRETDRASSPRATPLPRRAVDLRGVPVISPSRRRGEGFSPADPPTGPPARRRSEDGLVILTPAAPPACRRRPDQPSRRDRPQRVAVSDGSPSPGGRVLAWQAPMLFHVRLDRSGTRIAHVGGLDMFTSTTGSTPSIVSIMERTCSAGYC